MFIYGMNVQTNEALVDIYQFRFPRSKKKRIRIKWAKNEENLATRPSEKMVHFGLSNTVICHPSMLPRLKQAFDLREKQQAKSWQVRFPIGFGLPFRDSLFSVMNPTS